MKKWIGILLAMVILFTLAGCGADDTASRTGTQQNTVNSVLEERRAEAESTAEEETSGEPAAEAIPVPMETPISTATPVPTETPIPTVTPAPAETSVTSTKAGVDIDLTAMSSTMVYSEVYQMMVIPEEYLGKSVKMRGTFALYQDEATGQNYYACIIQDATACCAQGIEFELEGDYTYPDDYPARGTEITVEGIFDTYYDGDFRYCTLRNAELV